MEKLEPEEVRIFLRNLFDDRFKGVEMASKFLNVINDRQKEIKKFIYKALDMGVITLTNKGEYKYKEHFIGFSFESVVAWVQNSENKDLLLQIREECGTPIVTPSFFKPEEEVVAEQKTELPKEAPKETATTSTRGRKKST